METFLFLLSFFLILLGGTVTILFWIPKLVNQARLREMLGSRYPLVFFVYLANGPLLIFLGMFLLIRFT